MRTSLWPDCKLWKGNMEAAHWLGSPIAERVLIPLHHKTADVQNLVVVKDGDFPGTAF